VLFVQHNAKAGQTTTGKVLLPCTSKRGNSGDSISGGVLPFDKSQIQNAD